ncbi:hypothetical protein EBQ74_05710 [bacterium]|nr:hypothetical protein [bacterium]
MTEDQEIYDEQLKGTVLNSYLGIESDIHPLRVVQETISINPGQSLLLASDGLFKQMSDMRIVNLIREHAENPEKLVLQLCEEASHTEYSDNVTVVFVRLLE